MKSFLFVFNGLVYAFRLNFKILCFSVVLVALVSPRRYDKAGAVKDLAAAAVLVISLLALIIGLFIFVPKFI